VTEPSDAIVRTTSVTICGSDLHIYLKEVPAATGQIRQGDILGHEAVGVVEEVGPQVTKFKKGDRVAISAVIACGQCEFCEREQFSLCDRTNPSSLMHSLYGDRTAALFGYSHLTGGYPGTHAEYVRVPLADVNLLKLDDQIRDEQAVLLSDVCCTAWHANELGEVKEGSTVAIWGAGPVGLMTAYMARVRGAARIIVIDHHKHRLELACRHAHADTINFEEEPDVPKAVRRLLPNGPDVCIDCAGFRFPKGYLHKLMRGLKLETDSAEIVNEMIHTCKKGGVCVLIGDYFGFANNFPIGPCMEKSIRIHGGQVFVQKYWKHIQELMLAGKVDPTWLFSNRMNFEEIEEAFKCFTHDREGCIKVLLTTPFGRAREGQQSAVSSVQPERAAIKEGSAAPPGSCSVSEALMTSLAKQTRPELHEQGQGQEGQAQPSREKHQMLKEREKEREPHEQGQQQPQRPSYAQAAQRGSR